MPMFESNKQIHFLMALILVFLTAFSYIQYELGNAMVIEVDDENF